MAGSPGERRGRSRVVTMKPLFRAPLLRTLGFDDAPASPGAGARVPVTGVVCSGTRFEGMVFGHVRRDGRNATDVLVRLLAGGKFLPQLHLVLVDGLTLGGFNVVDLRALAVRLGRPCVAVMRRPPDLEAVHRALAHLPRTAERRSLLARAGPVYQRGGFVFQVQGAGPEEVAPALARITDRGRIPEPLRLAHLIGAAIVLGESGRRA
ncbi:MAG: DUF99 family protein [Myxococcaceae bacterium]|nr:DUF99 family protein [Myxococcaceae bacterium]